MAALYIPEDVLAAAANGETITLQFATIADRDAYRHRLYHRRSAEEARLVRAHRKAILQGQARTSDPIPSCGWEDVEWRCRKLTIIVGKANAALYGIVEDNNDD